MKTKPIRLLVVLALAGCAAPIAPESMSMNLARDGATYKVSGRYGPGWSEGDVRGEVEAACRAKAMRLSRFRGQPYTETGGTAYEARCSPAH